MEVDLTKTAVFAVRDPKLITVDFEHLELLAKQQREADAKVNPPVTEPAEKELRKLRRELFCLTERSKSCETYCNNIAGNVRHAEQQLADALKEKKSSEARGNELWARGLESRTRLIEKELANAKREFKKAQLVATQAAHELKAWPHHARLAELQKIVG